MTNTKAVFTFLKKINEPLKEDYVPTLSNRIIEHFKTGLRNKEHLVVSALIMHKHVTEEFSKETADVLFERLVEHNIAPKALTRHDIGTPQGYMDAHDEVMAEMMSGAAIGGRMSGLGTNAQVNATGMAGVDKPLGKKKKIISRLGKTTTSNL